jgi:hypothetical protein
MAQRNDTSFFEQLIRPMLRHLRHIARLTQGEHTVDDLKSEAWLIAEEIKAERGAEIEPDDEELQATIVSRLHKLFGRFVNRAMRFAVRLDLEERDDDGDYRTNALAARLNSAEQYEPPVAIQLAADADEAEKQIHARFSEAVAYYHVFDHFDGDGDAIARYLAIRSATLAARLAVADATARRQPSVFDGVTAVPADFMPRRGTRRVRRAQSRFWRVCGAMRPAQKHLFLRYGAVFR